MQRNLPTPEITQKYFGIDAHLTAAKYVIIAAKKRLYSGEELALMRRYLSQWPDGPQLPDDVHLRALQCIAEHRRVMGDTTQGVHDVYWREGHAIVAALLHTITAGKMQLVPYDRWRYLSDQAVDIDWIIKQD